MHAKRLAPGPFLASDDGSYPPAVAAGRQDFPRKVTIFVVADVLRHLPLHQVAELSVPANLDLVAVATLDRRPAEEAGHVGHLHLVGRTEQLRGWNLRGGGGRFRSMDSRHRQRRHSTTSPYLIIGLFRGIRRNLRWSIRGRLYPVALFDGNNAARPYPRAKSRLRAGNNPLDGTHIHATRPFFV